VLEYFDDENPEQLIFGELSLLAKNVVLE